MLTSKPETTNKARILKLIRTLLLPALAFLAASGSVHAAIGGGYEATIQRTSYGIPHIRANSLANAWFGQGYAMAEDRGCVVFEQMVKIRSQRSRYFGEQYLDSDFGYQHLGLMAAAKRDFAKLPANIKEMLKAHAAGISAYLAAKGKAKLPLPCRNAEWVNEVSHFDLFAYSMDFTLLNSSRTLLPFLSNATPPSGKSGLRALSKQSWPSKVVQPGSNGWGIGKDYTDSGNSILLAQPHFPWEGEFQSWESQVTVPGLIDIYGATLPGIPNQLIGFNNKVAWTITTTSSPKASLYKLALVPGKPTQYYYDGKIRKMSPSVYQVVVRLANGRLEKRSRTLYCSHYGPMLTIPASVLSNAADYSWDDKVAISYRDVNSDNRGFLSQFLAMSKAQSFASFVAAHKQWNSSPLTDTIAVAGSGESWFADNSPVPHISEAAYQAWQQAVLTEPGIKALADFDIYTLDGSTSRDEWLTTDKKHPGLIPFSDAPQQTRFDYVFNANDSHWLTNADALLEGYNPLFGVERKAPSLRSRMNAVALSEPGTDGKFSFEEVQAAALNNRSLTAELIKTELVERCTKNPILGEVDLSKACAVLSAWDGTFDLDSPGAVLFREFLGSFTLTGRGTFTGEGDTSFFAKPFDANDPLFTPSGLSNLEIEGFGNEALYALAKAVGRLTNNGFDLNATLRTSQFAVKGDKMIPIHGGNEREGIMNISAYRLNDTVLPPTPRGRVLNPNTGFTRQGYPVNFGTTFLMALEMGSKGVVACQAVTAFSQSADPESPFYSDQTEMFSNKQWRPCLYSQKQIKADPKLRTYKVAKP